MNKRHELLRTIWDEGPDGEKFWKGGRYGRRGETCPFPNVLRELAKEGLVEVETRTCSPWNGEPPPSGTVQDRLNWNQRMCNIVRYKQRVEVVARLLPKGIVYCSEVLGL